MIFLWVEKNWTFLKLFKALMKPEILSKLFCEVISVLLLNTQGLEIYVRANDTGQRLGFENAQK